MTSDVYACDMYVYYPFGHVIDLRSQQLTLKHEFSNQRWQQLSHHEVTITSLKQNNLGKQLMVRYTYYLKN